MAGLSTTVGSTPELSGLASLAKLVSGDNLPTGALQTAAQATNGEDVSAKRWQGISDAFQPGQLTPLTAILKGVTGAVASGKSEKAQAIRDQKQAQLDQLLQYKANLETHQAEVQQMLAAHQEATVSGAQLAQSIDQLAAGDESGIRNWLASNPESAKRLSTTLGAPVEGARFTQMNGVDVMIPYGKDGQGNLVSGEAVPVDTLLKAYAPAAYQARYATRQENALADKTLELKDAQVDTEKAQAANYRAQADAKTNPQPKPLPAPAVKLQQEALDAIGTIGQTNSNIDKILADIDSGQLKTDLANRTVSAAANYVGHSTPQSRSLANYQSNLKKMVNDSLLLAKGVQTEGDAQRAADAILAAPFDTEAVKDRLTELRGINARSAELKKLQNDQLRAEFGHEPMDYTAYEGQSATQASPAASAPVTARNPKTGERLILQNGQWVRAQ